MEKFHKVNKALVETFYSSGTSCKMAGNSKKDLRAEAKSFSASLSNVYLMKKRDPQTRNLLEKAQQLIDDLLSESGRAPPSTPSSRSSRPGAGMGQLWVKLDELKRENDDLKRQRVERVRSVEEQRSGSPKSPKSPKAQNASTTMASSADVARLKAENENLQTHVDKLQKTVKEHQDLLSKLQDDYRRSKSALEAAQKVAKKAREDTKKTEANLASVKGERDAIKHNPENVVSLCSYLTCGKSALIWPSAKNNPTSNSNCSASSAPSSKSVKLTQSPPPVPAAKPNISSPKPKSKTPPGSGSPQTKPSSKTSTPTRTPPPAVSEPRSQSQSHSHTSSPPKQKQQQHTLDNRHTENINEKCRPSNIALAYTTLESQQWMDAKEALEEYDAEEEEIARFLCDILMSSYQACTTVLFSVEKVIQHLLSHPTLAVELLTKFESTSNCKLPEDISSLVCQNLRASFDKIDTSILAKMTRYNLNQTSSAGKLVSHWAEEPLQNYVKECANLSWQMAIQRPAMKLAAHHTRYDQEAHRLWWSCKQSSARTVNYVFWPALYDYEGGSLMVKAYVHAS